mmetsp:Transcript_13479/g.44979  ORF Transcript_13479/g.44979 Transcript_13479/m.44979 type:complete len:226 (-) Transcript_13479:74-751(-)
MAPTMKLVYFDAKGVVEKTRYMLAAAGAEYEDFRYEIAFGTPGDYSTLQRPKFDADKAAGKFNKSMGKVPILEVGDVQFAQSKAIERYVAKTYGFLGKTDLEAAVIDSFVEHERDLKDAYQKARGASAADKPAAMEKWFGTDLPDLLAKVEAALPAPTGAFMFGDELSLADICFYCTLEEFFDNMDGVRAAVEQAKCHRLAAVVAAVKDHPKIAHWRTTRPQTNF